MHIKREPKFSSLKSSMCIYLETTNLVAETVSFETRTSEYTPFAIAFNSIFVLFELIL